MTSSASSLLFSSGQSGGATITVAPVRGFAADVALTCTVTSTLGATTCSLSPATVTGGNGTSTLTINAATLTGMLRGAPLPFSHRGVGAYGTLVFSLGMVLTMKPRRRPRGKGWRNGLLGLLLLGVMLGLVSCGGGAAAAAAAARPHSIERHGDGYGHQWKPQPQRIDPRHHPIMQFNVRVPTHSRVSSEWEFSEM